MIRKTILILLAAASMTACGYRLAGSGAFLPKHIRTILIRNFENQTSRYQAEQFVTFAVRDEFLRRSRLKLVETIEQADSVLEGKITSFKVSPVSYSESAADRFQVSIMLDIRLMDLKQGRVLFENRNLRFVDTYDIDSADFFSMETETLQRISRAFATSVVTSILEDF
ncbi:MAG: LPS assembly lipoprotein LptE [Acidobacteriota bacterium]|nr:LPS assembly lipoprotein LptE [Acidobacteriota bacterium]